MNIKFCEKLQNGTQNLVRILPPLLFWHSLSQDGWGTGRTIFHPWLNFQLNWQLEGKTLFLFVIVFSAFYRFTAVLLKMDGNYFFNIDFTFKTSIDNWDWDIFKSKADRTCHNVRDNLHTIKSLFCVDNQMSFLIHKVEWIINPYHEDLQNHTPDPLNLVDSINLKA